MIQHLRADSAAFKALSLALLLSMATSASADSAVETKQKASIFASRTVEFGIHTGLANVKAHELVYIGSYKLSELIWDTNNAFMVGGDVSATLAPSWGLKLNARLSTAIGKPDSTMDDYDWLVVGADWSDWSHHDNTDLKKGLTADVNLSANLYANKSKTFVLDALLGYKRDQWKWGSVGGSFIYSTFTFRDTIGTFANIPVISYEQTIDTPYIGMAFEWTERYLTLGVKIIGSRFANAKAVDHHFLRSIVFTDTFKRGNMIGGDFDLTYHATENASFNIFYSFQSYFENRGNAANFDQSTGITTYFQNGAGMSLGYQTFGIGANYAF